MLTLVKLSKQGHHRFELCLVLLKKLILSFLGKVHEFQELIEVRGISVY